MRSNQKIIIDSLAFTIGQGETIRLAREIATADGDDSLLHELDSRRINEVEAAVLIGELRHAATLRAK